MRTARHLALVERRAEAAGLAGHDLDFLDEVTARVKAHQARRRRRLQLRSLWSLAWAQRDRALAVLFTLTYWFWSLSTLGMTGPLLALLACSASLLWIAVLAAVKIQPQDLVPAAAPPAEPTPAAGPPEPGMVAALRCFSRRRHNPTRHPMGAFRCSDCGTAGADLEEMGYDQGSGYVSHQRKTFGREPGQGITRTDW